jgi:hypothetical protein
MLRVIYIILISLNLSCSADLNFTYTPSESAITNLDPNNANPSDRNEIAEGIIVSLSSLKESPTNETTIKVTALFSAPVSDFSLDAVSAKDASLDNLEVVSASEYTFDATITAAQLSLKIVEAKVSGTEGNSNLGSEVFNMDLDETAPTVISVTADPLGGEFRVGDLITVKVLFSEIVTVTDGLPKLTLETGATDTAINYTSGSGTNTLEFEFSVAAGQNLSNLDYTSVSALDANGASVADLVGNNAILALPSPGSLASLGANTNINIDNTAPTVLSVAADPLSGEFRVGNLITIKVLFIEIVTVTDGVRNLSVEGSTM